MNHCKHTGCTAESLDDSPYCGQHQLVTGKVRQRTTRGGEDPANTGNPSDTGRANNPPHERDEDKPSGRTRGG